MLLDLLLLQHATPDKYETTSKTILYLFVNRVGGYTLVE